MYDANNDLSVIKFRDYGDTKSNAVNPTITLCFSREMVYPKGDYKVFEDGLSLLFNATTITVEDFLAQFGVLTTAGLTWWVNDEKLKSEITRLGARYLPFEQFDYFHVSYEDFQTKCFSLNIPTKNTNKISYIGVYLNSTIFPRETKKHPNLGIFLHYPNRLLLEPIYKLWLRKKGSNSYKKRYHFIKIQGMEVIKQRNKKESPCNEDNMDEYDGTLLNKIASRVGCKPPYWNITNNLDMCTHKSNLSLFANVIKNSMNLLPMIVDDMLDEIIMPCTIIRGVNLEYDNIPIHGEMLEKSGQDIEQLIIYFYGTKYKEIHQIRKMDWEGYISYAGGYIGLYLGLGLMQVPEMIMSFIKKCISIFRNNCK